jgi:hypothetical protein
VKFPGQGPGIGWHAPAPLHVATGVRTPDAQVCEPHVVLVPGNSHTPVLLQPAGAHAPPFVGAHATSQQLPVPESPHTELLHWSSLTQMPPGGLRGRHLGVWQ